MTEGDDAVRLWLVEREYNDKGLLTLVYATTDGQRYRQSSRSSQMLSGSGVSAATTADPGDLATVADSDRRERYASEAQRMADRHDPDDDV